MVCHKFVSELVNIYNSREACPRENGERESSKGTKKVKKRNNKSNKGGDYVKKQ